MKIRPIALLLGSLAFVSACDGLKEALTAHVDVVARAQDHELSVDRLAQLLGSSTLQIPVNRETARIITDLWTNYQLLGTAAAHNDSLADPKLVDEAALGVMANARLRRFMETVSKSFSSDSASETTYNQATGGLFVARHILFPVPGNASPQQRDSVRRKAEGVRAQLTTANFEAMAKKYSGDPGSAQRGGSLGAFHQGDMVKPFSDAVAALRPGQISPLVETQFGYHIILRPTYASAKSDYDAAFGQSSAQRAESLYIAKVDQEMSITPKSNAATLAKAAARELPEHREDKAELATFKGGDLTVSRFVRWVESYPPQMRLAQQLAQAPDTLVREFVKSMARNEVLLKKADSAGITVTPEEKNQMHTEFRQLVLSLWQQLGVDPKQLADSAKNVPERDRLAATRVDNYLGRIMSGQAQPFSVPTAVQTVMTSKYTSKVYAAGLDRAVERAKKLRASADSARVANQPRSQVPLPAQTPDTGARRDTTNRGKKP